MDDSQTLKIQEIITRLKRSEWWTAKSMIKGNSIVNVKCSECGKPEAWAYAASPFSINCNRANKCGARVKTLSLFPELWRDIEIRHRPTKKEPHLPAKRYLNLRGLDKSLEGVEFQYWKRTRKGCGGAVMFSTLNGNGDEVFNGRLFNPPKGEKKGHNKGSTTGATWRHPALEYKANTETFVTEGIIDALSLIEIDKQAIAVLSAGQDPSKVDLSGSNKLIFAFDNDPAGAKATKNWKEQFPDASAIMPIKGDWNDLLLQSNKENAREFFDKNRPEYEFQARLAIAETAEKYAETFHAFRKKPAGLFTFNKCYYHSFLKRGDDKKSVTVLAANFTLTVDHFRVDVSNPNEPTYQYHLKITPARGRALECTVSANELSSPQALTNTFLHRAKVLWQGEKAPSRALVKRIVESSAPEVRQLPIKGHDKRSGCYVFRQFMINAKGDVEHPNKNGFYIVSKNEYIRAAQTPDLNPVKHLSPDKSHDLLCSAWGPRAATGLAWTIASWFVQEVKDKIKFFPLLSFFGDSQTGKTAFTRILNACQCVDEEGLPMRKANTEKGVLRKLSQRAGLFQALLEENKDRKSKFDYTFCLTAYNDAPLQVRANKTLDNTTTDLALLSTILFVQNVEPFETKPEKERVISLEFKADLLSDNTTEAFDELLEIKPEEFAYLYQFVMTNHLSVKKTWYDIFERTKSDLKGAIKDARIRENHALILAFHKIFCKLAGVYYDLQPYIEEIGQKKIESCLKNDVSVADIFIEALLENHENLECADYREDQQRLYVRLTLALGHLRDLGIVIQTDTLLKELRNHPAYITGNKSHRFRVGAHKSWWFDTSVITKTDRFAEREFDSKTKAMAEVERARTEFRVIK